MSALIEKLSSYNIFNYLLPGVLFAAIVDRLTSFNIIQKDLIVGLFLYYFIGSVISRIGSLIIEPLLKWTRFVEFAPYEDFVRASKNDQKIETLSESNNMYRTLVALMVTIASAVLYDRASVRIPLLAELAPFFFIGACFVLFLYSYRKQTSYIKRRVNANSP